MAAKRGKSQAKRNSGGDGSLPGWAWMVLGILLAVVVILVAPKYLKSDGDGFFRPQPNPDARPAAVSGADDEAIAFHAQTDGVAQPRVVVGFCDGDLELAERGRPDGCGVRGHVPACPVRACPVPDWCDASA